MEKPIAACKHCTQLWFVLLVSSVLCFLLIALNYSSLLGIDNAFDFSLGSYATENPVKMGNQVDPLTIVGSKSNLSATTQKGQVGFSENPDSCLGRYIYIHDLPTRFNLDLLKNCSSIPTGSESKMCDFLGNSGLGPRIDNSDGVLLNNSWFSTSQFLLEVIFHNRMRQYECLTNNSSLASAVFVPFYIGLDVSRFLWKPDMKSRDTSGFEVAKWLSEKPEWKRLSGRDHFLVGGRIAWDFRRQTDNETDWGSKFMFLPESNNLTMLSIESSVWKNDFAIPYPTYFHPSTDSEVFEWQEKMRSKKRNYLFTFAGAARPDRVTIRGEIIKQCNASVGLCNFVDCRWGSNKCNDPVSVMKVLENSVFCLQPGGDSYTRRATFDSILAGCIPVFFHSGTAYVQYVWYLPKDHTKYSVYIPMSDEEETKANIKDRLLQIPEDKVVAMREEVIKLIPKVVYADPRGKLETVEDAFDVAVKAVLDRTAGVRRAIEEGRDPSVGFAGPNHFKFKFPIEEVD